MNTDVTQMTDTQLVVTIRQIEASPTAHRSFAIMEQVRAYLRELRDEAARRGLTV
jgi:hypothetical protein